MFFDQPRPPDKWMYFWPYFVDHSCDPSWSYGFRVVAAVLTRSRDYDTLTGDEFLGVKELGGCGGNMCRFEMKLCYVRLFELIMSVRLKYVYEKLIKREIVKRFLTSSHRILLLQSRAVFTLFEQGGPKEDLCMIAFQPQGVFVWEGAEAVHLQAEETKLEYSRNIVTNSCETPSWREIVSLTVLVKLASFT
nr:hypothetical protein [Tanacetum cinerariifolium]